jgi:hypothetical protein
MSYKTTVSNGCELDELAPKGAAMSGKVGCSEAPPRGAISGAPRPAEG